MMLLDCSATCHVTTVTRKGGADRLLGQVHVREKRARDCTGAWRKVQGAA